MTSRFKMEVLNLIDSLSQEMQENTYKKLVEELGKMEEDKRISAQFTIYHILYEDHPTEYDVSATLKSVAFESYISQELVDKFLENDSTVMVYEPETLYLYFPHLKAFIKNLLEQEYQGQTYIMEKVIMRANLS